MFITENELSGIGGSIHVEADTNYSGAIGAQLLVAEGFANDFALFGAGVRADAKEVTMVKEGAGEEAISTLQEGAVGNFYNKLKEIVKRIIAKIKGIFTGFIAKMQAWMGRDGRKFFDAHKKDIFGKNIDGLKFRYSKSISGKALIDPANITATNPSDEDKETSDLVEEYLGELTDGKCKDKGTFRKDFHGVCFDEEDKSYEAKTSEVAEYVKFISGKDDIIAGAKKAVANCEKTLTAYARALDKRAGAVTKNVVADKGDGNTEHDYASTGMKFSGKNDTGSAPAPVKSTNSEAQKKLHADQKRLSAMNEAFGMYSSAYITECKFAVSQSRRIAAAIVAYRAKKNEDADLVELAQENAEYEFYSTVEAL